MGVVMICVVVVVSRCGREQLVLFFFLTRVGLACLSQ